MSFRTIIPAAMRRAYETLRYAPAVQVDALIFCSGVIGRGDTAEAEFHDAWARIGEVLAEAGADYSDIVDLTIYAIDLAAHAPVLARVNSHYVREPYPAATWIEATGFVRKGARAEIKVTARVKA